MGLKLKELQKIANNVVRKEKYADILREEVSRAFGPTILTSRGIARMAESVNHRIDYLEATGKSVGEIRPSLLVKFIDSEHPEVRKMVARLIPENFLKPLMKDKSDSVRAAVAKRLPAYLVKEMATRFSNDDTLRTIYKTKKLYEAGLPNPEISDEPFDMYGEEPLNKTIGDIEHPGLTDTWYQTQAHKIYNMYGRNIEQQWEENTVHRYVESMKSMGLEVDHDKLLDAVYELMEDRRDEVLGEGLLSSLAKNLRMQDTEFMPVISETVDHAKQLISSGYTTSEYIEKFEETFKVKYVTVKNPARRALSEGANNVRHPISAQLPGSVTRNVDERAVDAYVNAWNTKESMKGNVPYRLSWSHDTEQISMINFNLELK